MAASLLPGSVAFSNLPAAPPPLSDRVFDQFRSLIHETTGIDLNETKKQLLESRLARRLRTLNLSSFDDYLALITKSARSDPEFVLFINCITTNKTDFFREVHHFDYLTQRVFPTLLERAASGGKRKLRIWCSASSTGEEPYTLAMTVLETFSHHPGWDIRILCTDIDTEVLSKAELGVYPEERFVDVPPELKSRWFERDKSDPALWRARSELKRILTFRRLNLIEPWPFNTVFDVIFCRNVLIYFNRSTQKRIILNFAKHLDPSGWLFLGHSESLHGLVDCFKGVERTVYQPANAAPASVPDRPMEVASRTTPAPVSPPKPPMVVTLLQKRIIAGEVFASAKPAQVSTVLGSCVTACLFDPELKIGGMNHFMLPSSDAAHSESARFGVHAMEVLINELMKLGADRRRLEAKVFGAGHVLRGKGSMNAVPEKNARFIREFLAAEQIPMSAQRLGGNNAVEVKFQTHTGRVSLKVISPANEVGVLADEQRYAVDMSHSLEKSRNDDVILF